jgi:arginine decarboxylase
VPRGSTPQSREDWTVEDSASLYSLDAWGAPYVAADKETGRVIVRPLGNDAEALGFAPPEIDLFALAENARARLASDGPVVVRFPDIACREAARLHAIFEEAAATWNYGPSLGLGGRESSGSANDADARPAELPGGDRRPRPAYQGVFPVKCCHDVELLRALVSSGAPRAFGLEAGSKAELLLAVAVMRSCERERATADGGDARLDAARLDAAQPLLVCNGYKDASYVRVAFEAAAAGTHVALVVEKLSEIEPILERLRDCRAAANDGDDDGDASKSDRRLRSRTPVIGVRVRLGTTHDGQWGATSGDDAKFGLGARETLFLVRALRDAGFLSELRLLHFHVGSQVSDIATIKEAMRESSQMYAELVRLGAPMGLIDVGGGLGVDYDGSKGWGGRASVNYDAANYANDVVAALADACTRAGIEPPTIVSESGRAIVSASAALVFQIISTDPRGARGGDGTRVASGTETGFETDAADVGAARLAVATEAPPRPTLEALRSMPPSRFLLHNFREVARSLATAETVNAQEAINDATQFRREADRLFKLGIMGLEERAEAEELFCATREGVFEIARARRRKRSLSSNTRADAEYALPVDVQTEARRPAVWYHANMSVFRSLPDVWAIQQLFPVAPLHRLRERPRAAGAVADLTCDSDGRIDAFVGALSEELGGGADAERGAPSPFLALHAPNAGEPYLMAAFLVGAYQESMGSAGHNLFGSPATANVFLDRPEPFETLPNPETGEETREPGRLSFRFASPALSGGAGAVVSLRAGDTNAEALRGAGVDPDSIAAWVRGGGGEPTGGGDGDAALLAAVADVLRESTYLESRGLG